MRSITRRRHPHLSGGSSRAGLCLVGVLWACMALQIGAGKTPLKVLKYDPQAETIELFAGIEAGQYEVRMVPENVSAGQVFIKNTTDKPLTVKLPKSFVGVHVLKQVGNLGFGPQVGVNGGFQTGAGQSGNFGNAQSQGAGFGNFQNGNNAGNGQNNGIFGQGAQNFFSVPAERTVRVPYVGVCLNYGKPDPMSRMTYHMVRTADFTSDAALHELLDAFGTGAVPQQVAQAATWHLTDELSWKQLTAQRKPRAFGVPHLTDPVFSKAQIEAAEDLVERSQKLARQNQQAVPAQRVSRSSIAPESAGQ